MEAQNLERGRRINYITNDLLFTGMELINSPMCCKLKFIRMYNTIRSCRRTLLYACMLVCKSAWLDFELITQFIVSKWAEDVLFLQWESSLPQPQVEIIMYLLAGWTMMDHRPKWEAYPGIHHLCSLQLPKHQSWNGRWPAKNRITFYQKIWRFNAYERWATTIIVTTIPV